MKLTNLWQSYMSDLSPGDVWRRKILTKNVIAPVGMKSGRDTLGVQNSPGDR